MNHKVFTNWLNLDEQLPPEGYHDKTKPQKHVVQPSYTHLAPELIELRSFSDLMRHSNLTEPDLVDIKKIMKDLFTGEYPSFKTLAEYRCYEKIIDYDCKIIYSKDWYKNAFVLMSDLKDAFDGTWKPSAEEEGHTTLTYIANEFRRRIRKCEPRGNPKRSCNELIKGPASNNCNCKWR